MKQTNKQLKDNYKQENILYRKVIKLKCLDCLNDCQIDCEIDDCSLYPYRPFKKSVAK
jgi:hypothetical protein